MRMTLKIGANNFQKLCARLLRNGAHAFLSYTHPFKFVCMTLNRVRMTSKYLPVTFKQVRMTFKLARTTNKLERTS